MEREQTGNRRKEQTCNDGKVGPTVKADMLKRRDKLEAHSQSENSSNCNTKLLVTDRHDLAHKA